MKTIVKDKIKLFSLPLVYHCLIWTLILLGLIYINESNESTISKFVTELINVSFYVLLIYVNYLFLIPNYLEKKRHFVYLVFVIFAVSIITSLRLIFHYYRLNGFEEIQFDLLDQKMIFFVSSFLFVIISTVLKVISDWFRHQQKVNYLQRQHLESEIKFLKSQINPHFLFNTLNSLYALTLKKSDDAPKTVLQLSEMMRYMLYECNEPKVLLSRELKYITNYINLEKIRHRNEIEININIEGDKDDVKISPLIFISFLENSFKHGIRNQIGKAFIDIKFKITNNRLIFECKNSISKINIVKPKSKNSGVGLVNVKRRLELLYKNRYTLKISEENNIYYVNLTLDL